VYLPSATEKLFHPAGKENYHREGTGTGPVADYSPGGTVLLVDDEEIVRNMAAVMLRHLGFTVREAKDGLEAMEIFRDHPGEIRFVLCDLTMPHMDDWQTLTALHQITHGVPAILAIGYDKSRFMAESLAIQPQAFLNKPYHLKKLSQAIGIALCDEEKRK
jgi:two-component system, cell cycle sensor histidine kinase and response regulator CckA